MTTAINETSTSTNALDWTGADPASSWVALAAQLAPSLALDAAELDRTGDFRP